ncbi:Hypothetical predicted protein [Mytilus galloprovincialis]|nr:Hypothetical predicted protein [Mytilus galloprovincialis]
MAGSIAKEDVGIVDCWNPCSISGLWHSPHVATLWIHCNNDSSLKTAGTLTGKWFDKPWKSFQLTGRYTKVGRDVYLGFTAAYTDSVASLTGFYSDRDRKITTFWLMSVFALENWENTVIGQATFTKIF